MTKISGWIFMAIGAGVSLFSKYVQNRGGKGMALFFWVGIGMIGLGIFKVVVGFITRDEARRQDKSEQKKYTHPLQRLGLNKDLDNVDGQRLEKEKQQAMNNIQQTNIRICATCGTKHYSNSNFCHICGTKLK
jgi:hypothetical protein